MTIDPTVMSAIAFLTVIAFFVICCMAAVSLADHEAKKRAERVVKNDTGTRSAGRASAN